MGADGAGAKSESIGVFARFKPVKGTDTRGEIEISKYLGQQKSVSVKGLEFTLDWIFDTDSTQEQIFETAAKDRIDTLLAGFNVTMMAYGQTGSGKTHTMFGPDEVLTDFNSCDPAHHGLVPRCAIRLFEGIQNGSADSTFIVQASYLEVYNDKLNDMLGMSHAKGPEEMKHFHDLKMLPTAAGGISVQGLTQEVVTSVEEVMEALGRGQDQRVVRLPSRPCGPPEEPAQAQGPARALTRASHAWRPRPCRGRSRRWR